MSDEITLIGGSHHLTTTREQSHLIARRPLEKMPEIPVGPPPHATASIPIAVEYYDLREYFVFGTRYLFYVFRGLNKEEAARLVDDAIRQ